MSSFYDDASLVVIPSGYKTSKVYAEKPTDGSGDLTFTRTGDTATRVNSAGLIEKVRTNLVLQSQTFDNASWTKSNSTITANSISAPDGTTTADTLNVTATAYSSIYNTASFSLASGLYTQGVYAKKGTKNFLYILDFGASTAKAWYNLDTGAVGTVAAGYTATMQDAGNGWYRCTLTPTSAVTPIYFQFGASDTDNSDTPSSSGTIYIWGAQLETGDIATDYIPTTSAAVSVGPVSNVPRLDYLGSSCPRLLLEPQRTNLVTYSEQIDNAAWIKQTTTISANSSVSPDGYSNADKVAINNGVSGGYVYRNFATTSSTVYTTSFFVKAAGINFTKFYSNVTGSYVTAVINLTTGAITNSEFATTPTATNYGNGWWRVSYTETSGGGSVPIYVDGGSTSTGGGITGNGTDGILIWGAQLEAGAYATSYIPTLGASVTRVADAASKTGISSLIGQTEGTLFCEFFYNEENKTPNGSDKSVMRVESGGGYSNEITILYYGNEGSIFGKTIQSIVTNGGVTQSSLKTTQTMVTGYYKVALAYKANDFALAVNGVIVDTDNSGTVPTCANFSLNESTRIQSDINPKQALLFKTRLTNAQLAELTTL